MTKSPDNGNINTSHEHCVRSPMLKTAQFIAYRTPKHSAPFKRANWVYISCTKCIPPTGLAQTRKFQNVGNTMDKPPKHQIVYFKGLTSEVREFGKFRKVLHTGLYSQLVAMEVPVGGEIGDEVSSIFSEHVLKSITFFSDCGVTFVNEDVNWWFGVGSHSRSDPALYLRQGQGYGCWKRPGSKCF